MNLKDISNVTITQLIGDLKTAGYTVQKLNPKKIAIEISHTTKKTHQVGLLNSIAENYNGEYIPKVRGTNSDGVRVRKNDKESILIVLDLKRDAEHFEKEEVNSINMQLTEIKHKINEKNKTGIHQNFVPLVFKNITYNVVECVQTPKDNNGKPAKSDFHFIDNKGNPCLWISHKAGKAANSFQQWGGITEDGEPKINSKKEVKDFINEVKKLYPKNFPDGVTLARKIKDNNIKKMGVYGHDYGSSIYGPHNVNYVLQGKIKIESSGSMKYTLKADAVTHSNGDDITGDYEPVLMVNYRKGRNNFQIKDARGSIYPIEGRKITKFI